MARSGEKRRGSHALRHVTLRQFESLPERQEGMWGISTVVGERRLCVRDLARLLVAIGTLDVNKAFQRIAEWKRLEAMYIVDAEIGKRPLLK